MARRVTDSPFMQQLRAGTLPLEVLRTFFKNWGSYTIEINTVEAASYHKHISFFANIAISWRAWRKSSPTN